ncbi:SHOCT domain-containing protein [Roseomonas sp. SSH11]|uniref:SHOCT domain-containing protein n=1 Tax=Pararoseomonas baculiformis TaxID=2820812 RepID=A0ABS4AMV1_9PROT|nr:SHOCT domain-containing protein [Pararoseomonas baculiformis]
MTAADSTGKAVEVISVAPRIVTFESRPNHGAEGDNTARRLKTLRDLFDEGLLSAVEYDAKRKEILGRL